MMTSDCRTSQALPQEKTCPCSSRTFAISTIHFESERKWHLHSSTWDTERRRRTINVSVVPELIFHAEYVSLVWQELELTLRTGYCGTFSFKEIRHPCGIREASTTTQPILQQASSTLPKFMAPLRIILRRPLLR